MNLDIQCEHLSDTQWKELLPRIQQVEVIRLDDCGLTEARCKDISSALQANPSLTELSLHNSELGDAGVCQVLQALQGPACKICKLRLEYCNLTAASCEPLAAVLPAKLGLRELVLSNNDLGEAGVQVLCRGLLGATCPLETLKLASCGVTAANCKDLCSIVATKDSLQELDLGESKLGDAGMAALCPGLLSPSSKLKTLWLWECDISSEGCREISQVLRAKESLKELSLMGNELGDQGARLLCEALREPGCRLESLWVKACGFTDACCPDFSTMLAQNKFLLELQLSNNKLGDAGVQQLCQGLSQPGATLQMLWWVPMCTCVHVQAGRVRPGQPAHAGSHPQRAHTKFPQLPSSRRLCTVTWSQPCSCERGPCALSAPCFPWLTTCSSGRPTGMDLPHSTSSDIRHLCVSSFLVTPSHVHLAWRHVLSLVALYLLDIGACLWTPRFLVSSLLLLTCVLWQLPKRGL